MPDPAQQRWLRVARRAAATGMAGVAAIAFLATTTGPTYDYDFPPGTTYQIDGARAAVRAYFLAHDWLSDQPESGNRTDTMTGLSLRITLGDVTPCGTLITLVHFSSRDSAVDLATVQLEFENAVITPLRQAFPTCS